MDGGGRTTIIPVIAVIAEDRLELIDFSADPTVLFNLVLPHSPAMTMNVMRQSIGSIILVSEHNKLKSPAREKGLLERSAVIECSFLVEKLVE